MCINNYECLSDSCDVPLGKESPECIGKAEGKNCYNDTECNVGLFCHDNVYTKKETCEK